MEDLVEVSPWAFETILDSKHITPTKSLKLYDIKLVTCGDYVQVYFYQNMKSRKENSKEEKENIIDTFDLELERVSKEKSKCLSNKIEERSIIRSKLECQRIAKANINEWETFITLTFADNVTSIDLANKRFRYFIDKVRRIKKDLMYLAIPEFQKRGAVHYHILTNISINDNKLIYTQEGNKRYKHVKYWDDGFTSVEPLKGDVKKIIGYISKYMTKDIDNRLFNRRRYFYSQNLNTPKVSYINRENDKDLDFYKKIIQDANLIYQNNYINSYDNSEVLFLEYLK